MVPTDKVRAVSMHNYEKKIQKLIAEGKYPSEPGKLYSTAVKHDDWCRVYLAGECNCDPEITITEITKENRAQVSKAIDDESAKFRQRIKDKMV
jgi:enamine deaminase RidA (YjgF/YER057c/UK114 family)